jgi:hypothetical protein
MKFIPDLGKVPYPDNEIGALKELEVLFCKWHQHFAHKGLVLEKHEADHMVFDGFYPYYFEQNKRILFIGRESRQLSTINYIERHFEEYRAKQFGDNKVSINRSKFDSRMLYIAYGILHEMPSWEKIDYASVIVDTFAKPREAKGWSFAVMNISKLSNDDEEHWQADNPVINAAYDLSTRPRNFIQEQIAILKPHIIICMSLAENKIEFFGEKLTLLSAASDQPKSYRLVNGQHHSLLINTWHFSARKKGNEDYYIPICAAIRKAKALDYSLL